MAYIKHGVTQQTAQEQTGYKTNVNTANEYDSHSNTILTFINRKMSLNTFSAAGYVSKLNQLSNFKIKSF